MNILKRNIWSDKSKTNRLNSDEISYERSEDPKSFPAEIIQDTLKSGGGAVMIWGFISLLDTGAISRVIGRTNSEKI